MNVWKAKASSKNDVKNALCCTHMEVGGFSGILNHPQTTCLWLRPGAVRLRLQVGGGLGGFVTLRGFQPISDDTAGSAEGCPWGIPRVGLVCVAQGSVRLRRLLSIRSNQKNMSARGDTPDQSCPILVAWSPSWGWPLEGTAATPTSPDCSPLREPPLLPTYLPQTSPPLG